MVIIKDETRQLIYNGNAEYIYYLTIGEVSIDTSNIKSIKVTDEIIDNQSKYMYIGTFSSKKIEIEFKNATEIDLSQTISLQVGVKSFDDDEILDIVNIGKFYADTTEKDYYQNAKIVAYDYGIKMKTPFNAEPYFNHDEETGEPTYINIVDLLQSICNYYGIQLGTLPNVNADMNIYSFDSTMSGKAYVSFIAELMGGNVKISRDNLLNIIPAKSEPVIGIPIYTASEYKLGEMYKISKVSYDNGVLLPSTFGNDDNNTLFIRTDNFLMSGDDDTRNKIVENIYNAVNGLELYSIEIKQPTDLSLDASDIVYYIDEENIYPTYYNITNNLGRRGTVTVKLPTIQQEATSNINENVSEETRIRAIKTYIDQENSTLRIDIENTVGKDVNDLKSWKNTLVFTDSYSKEEIKEIITGIGVDGQKVTSVTTETGIFDKNGLTIDNDSEENIVKSNLNQKGLSVIEKSRDSRILFVGYDDTTKETVVKTRNNTIEKYLTIGDYSRFEKYTDDRGNVGTGCFWIGD